MSDLEDSTGRNTDSSGNDEKVNTIEEIIYLVKSIDNLGYQVFGIEYITSPDTPSFGGYKMLLKIEAKPKA
jgi:hypothetical protein